MATCIYCGKPAGLFKKYHKECHQRQIDSMRQKEVDEESRFLDDSAILTQKNATSEAVEADFVNPYTKDVFSIDGKPICDYVETHKHDIEKMKQCCDTEIEAYNNGEGLGPPAPFSFRRVVILSSKAKNYEQEEEYCHKYIDLLEDWCRVGWKRQKEKWEKDTNYQSWPEILGAENSDQSPLPSEEKQRKTQKEALQSFFIERLEKKKRKQNGEKAIQDVPLTKQCEMLNIELLNLKLPKPPKGTKAASIVADNFRKQGYLVSDCSGQSFVNIVSACCFESLTKTESTEDVAVRRLGVFFHHKKQQTKIIISDCLTKALEEVLRSSVAINKHRVFVEFSEPMINIDFVEALFPLISHDQLKRLVELIILHPFKYDMGWPNLTMINDGKIELTVVKASGKLSENQLTTIPVIIDKLGFPVKVAKVKYTP